MVIDYPDIYMQPHNYGQMRTTSDNRSLSWALDGLGLYSAGSWSITLVSPLLLHGRKKYSRFFKIFPNRSVFCVCDFLDNSQIGRFSLISLRLSGFKMKLRMGAAKRLKTFFLHS